MRNFLFCLVVLVVADSAVGFELSSAPNLELWDNGIVYIAVEDSKGGLLVGGNFTRFMGEPRANVARIGPDGILDPNFAPDVSSFVYSIVTSADDSIIIGGDFSSVNGVSQKFLARLDLNGQLDGGWKLSLDGAIFSMTLDHAGGLVIGGLFTIIDGVAASGLARIAMDSGVVDDEFSFNVIGTVFAVSLDDSGHLWVGGEFGQIGNVSVQNLARLNLDTASVDSFSANDTVNAFAVGENSEIFVCGRFSSIDGNEVGSVARYLYGGVPDFSWTPSVNGPVFGCNTSTKGLLISGSFSEVDGWQAGGLARLAFNGGEPDLSFLPLFSGVYTALEGVETVNVFAMELPVGLVLAGGIFRYVGDVPVASSVILNGATGEVSRALDAEYPAFIRQIQPLDDGRTILAGSFRRAGEKIRDNILLLEADFTVSSAWSIGTNGEVRAVEKEGSSIFVGGFFGRLGHSRRMSIGRIDISGDVASVCSDWAPALLELPAVLTIQRDRVRPDHVYVAGAFSYEGPGDYLASDLIRLSVLGEAVPDTALEDLGVNGQVNAISQTDSGLIYVGGRFSRIRGHERRALMEFENDSTLTVRSSFDAGLNNHVWALASVDSSDSVFAAGQFTIAFGQSRRRLMKLSGSQLSDWSPSVGGGVPVAISVDPDEHWLYVSGAFEQVGGLDRRSIARIGLAGSGQVGDAVISSFAGSTIWSNRVFSDQIWLGGQFGVIGDEPRLGIARLRKSPTLADGVFSDRFQELEVPTFQSIVGASANLNGPCSPEVLPLGLRKALDPFPIGGC